VEKLALLLAQNQVSLNLTLPGIIALIAGILILIYPSILNYVIGLVGLPGQSRSSTAKTSFMPPRALSVTGIPTMTP
jgi:hypothetical protein